MNLITKTKHKREKKYQKQSLLIFVMNLDIELLSLLLVFFVSSYGFSHNFSIVYQNSREFFKIFLVVV